MKPILPPKAGYVEKVDTNGKHYYAPVKSEQRLLNLESSDKLLAQQVLASDDRSDFLEECLVEMANILYAE